MTTKPKREPRLDLHPSSADRWTTCTASPKYIFDNWDRLPPDRTKFNEEGTTAHEVAAAYLQDREPNPANCPTPIDEDMRWHAWNYMEYVQGLRGPRSFLHVEKKFSLWYRPERNAMIDAAVVSPHRLDIVDFKYGEGIVVSPENNFQCVIYATVVGKMIEEETENPISPKFPVSVHIYQPRGRNSVDSPAHVWETTWEQVKAISDWIADRANRIQNPYPYDPQIIFAPSDKACQWCPAKGFCPERQREFTKDLEMLQAIEPGEKQLTPTNVLTDAQLAAIVEHGDAIKKWIDDAQEYALQLVQGGKSLPGLKLVQGREGNRFWTDEEKAAQLLLKETILKESEVYSRKVLTVAQAEKLLGKNKMPADVASLIARPQGKLQLVPESDKREAYLVDAAKEFEVITDTDDKDFQ